MCIQFPFPQCLCSLTINTLCIFFYKLQKMQEEKSNEKYNKKLLIAAQRRGIEY